MLQAATRPNSWAAVSMWRRFFQLKDDEESEQVDTILAALEESTQGGRPIQSERAKEQMQNFRQSMTSRQQQLQITSNTPPSPSLPPTSLTDDIHQSMVRQHEEQVLNRPDLSIGPGSMYLAQ
jgi:hypothetical protein